MQRYFRNGVDTYRYKGSLEHTCLAPPVYHQNMIKVQQGVHIIDNFAPPSKVLSNIILCWHMLLDSWH